MAGDVVKNKQKCNINYGISTKCLWIKNSRIYRSGYQTLHMSNSVQLHKTLTKYGEKNHSAGNKKPR